MSDEMKEFSRLAERCLAERAALGFRSTAVLHHGLSIYRRWLEDHGRCYREVSVADAESFRTDLSTTADPDGKPHYAAKTVAMILWAVGLWYAWLVQNGYLVRSPFDALESVKLPRRVPRDIPDEKDLIDQLGALARFWEEDNIPNRRSRYRTHVIAETLYATGMRLGELGSLKPEDIDLDAKTVQIRDGKGGVSRTAYLNDYATSVLQVYLNQMREVVAYRQGNDTVWGTKAGNSIGGILNKNLVKYLGMHTHDFRHAVGTHLLKAGCDLRMIQLILGHEDLKSTAIYTKVAKEDLRDQLDRHHPRGGLHAAP